MDMYNEEKMYKALRTFDWPTIVTLLPEQNLESLRKLVSGVSRSGCLIRLYQLGAEQDELRAKMIVDLKALCAKLGGSNATSYFEFLLRQVEIVELALAEIDIAFDEEDYAALPAEQQAWSVLLWAAREMLDVYRQIQTGLDNHRKGEGVIIDPLTLRVDKEHGHGLAAGRVHQLSQTVANTLRMLCHRNPWDASGKFLLPPKEVTTESNLSAAARIFRLGDVWQNVVDESKHHRFWGGHFEVQDPDEEQKTVLPSLEHVIVSVKSERDRNDAVQIAEYIALNRMQRKQLIVFQDIGRSNAKDR